MTPPEPALEERESQPESASAPSAVSAASDAHVTRRELRTVAVLVVAYIAYVLWSVPRAKTVRPGDVAAPAGAASASPAGGAAPVAGDSYEDLFLHDMVGGLIAVSAQPEAKALRLTPEQRDALRRLWPDIRGVLAGNVTRPTPVDAKLRAVLTPAQKAAIRKLTSDSAYVMPQALSEYVAPFEKVMRGEVPDAAPVVTSSGGAASTPTASVAQAQPAPVATTPPAPVEKPRTVVDTYRDLFLHDLLGGLFAVTTEGSASLRLTADQRLRLRALAPQIRARLAANDTRPSKLDDEVRKILRPDQLQACRSLIAAHKVGLPPTLGEYRAAFDQLLEGQSPKVAADARRPSQTASPGPAGAPPKPTFVDPFSDVYLHDSLCGVLAFEREGPSDLRLTPAQRGDLARLWPEIKTRLQANDWKPSALDGRVRDVLTKAQKSAIHEKVKKHLLEPPGQLTNLVIPVERLVNAR
ncbi:MAG: hypothetical protein EB084_14545 [Proteobacteria bacterium]|nr:hypothetical protein [Pseudomonadota bacterium]